MVTATGDATGIITVNAESIDTKNPQRDKHLRSGDFFDIAVHPDITFAADGVSPAGDGVRVTGTLTIRDRARPASFDAKVSVADGEVQVDGKLQVNRRDFGMTWNSSASRRWTTPSSCTRCSPANRRPGRPDARYACGTSSA